MPLLKTQCPTFLKTISIMKNTKDNPIVHSTNPTTHSFFKAINHAKRGEHRKYENI